MDHIMQQIVEALQESGRFDNVSVDDDGAILVSEDGVLVMLTGAELDEEAD